MVPETVVEVNKYYAFRAVNVWMIIEDRHPAPNMNYQYKTQIMVSVFGKVVFSYIARTKSIPFAKVDGIILTE